MRRDGRRPLLCLLSIHRPHVADPPYGSMRAGRYNRRCTRCPYRWESQPTFPYRRGKS